MEGNLTNKDALFFYLREIDNPDHSKLYVIPPGTYNDTLSAQFSEFSDVKTSITLGAYYTSSQEKSWNLSHFSLGSRILTTDNTYQDTNKIDGQQQVNIPEVNVYDNNFPNISIIWPNRIVNFQKNFTIHIFGDNFQQGSTAFLDLSEKKHLSAQVTTVHSHKNISAVFSDLNMPSGLYTVGIMNPDGTSVYQIEGLDIFTPHKPIINGITPNIGINTGNLNITELKVSNFSIGDTVFLNRSGYQPIYATKLLLLSEGIISVNFDLTGEPVGLWNLTVKKPNGKDDICVDCFTITGPSPEYHTYQYDFPIENFIPNSKFEAIVIDKNDNVYLTDSSYNLIRKYSPDGHLLMEWGGTGNETGKFSYPSALAISPMGLIYVVDKENERIQKFNTDGIFQTTWGINGSDKGQFLNPSGISVDLLNDVYVSDTNNHRIQKFNADGEFIRTWGAQGGFNGQFNFPGDIASGFNDTLYVLDNGNDRIQMFDPNGRFINKWGTSGSNNGQFLSLGSITIDSMNDTYITDFSQNQVQKFNATGLFLTKWGSKGIGKGIFECADGIAVNSSGYVYVLDCINNHIHIFKSTEDNQFFETPPEEEVNPISNETLIIPEEEIPLEEEIPPEEEVTPDEEYTEPESEEY